MIRKIYVCSDSITGIFSGIYDIWRAGYTIEEAGIGIRGLLEQELFCDYLEPEETEQKARAVERLIQKHLGPDAYWDLYHALLTSEPGKGNAVLGAMLEARQIPDSRKIMEHLANPYVEQVFEMSRQVSNEAHLYTGRVRFRELSNGILFSEITPKTRVLTCLGDHFSDRFPKENWMIHDRTYGEYLIHPADRRWIVARSMTLNEKQIENVSQSEPEFERLWKSFCRTITIKERRNEKLQQQNLPKRYQRDMVECQP